MASDYMPKSLSNLPAWFAGIKKGVDTDGPTCNQSPAQITEDKDFINSLLTAVNAANAAETAALEAAGTARDLLKTNNEKLRKLINRYKNSNGWTEGMADAWQVKTHATQADMSEQKSSITARSVTGKNVISGRKRGFTSVTIQMRVDGTNDWIDIGVKVSHFPFYDTTAPQTEGKPEKREYRALGFIGDDQVGQPSDIVTAVLTS